MRGLWRLVILLMLVVIVGGCRQQARSSEQKTVRLKLAAAASLEKIITQKLIPMYQQANPNTIIEGTYAGSGKLQVQLEQGLEADVFISAANKQMQALKDKGLLDYSKPLLKNDLVLIVPKEKAAMELETFSDFPKAKQPAIGDPRSVPAGQYAQEALTNLKLWDKVEKRLSLGTNVVEVLNWVAEGSADAGLVYATDAANNPKVKVITTAPAGALKRPVIYPVGILKKSAAKEEAMKFVEFLSSASAQKVFHDYGFQNIENK